MAPKADKQDVGRDIMDMLGAWSTAFMPVNPLQLPAIGRDVLEVGTKRIPKQAKKALSDPDKLAGLGSFIAAQLDNAFKIGTGRDYLENQMMGEMDPQFSRLGLLPGASHPGHAAAAEGMARRFGPTAAMGAGLAVEPLEAMMGTHESGLTPDTLMDLMSNIAGAARPRAPSISDLIISLLTQGAK